MKVELIKEDFGIFTGVHADLTEALSLYYRKLRSKDDRKKEIELISWAPYGLGIVCRVRVTDSQGDTYVTTDVVEHEKVIHWLDSEDNNEIDF